MQQKGAKLSAVQRPFDMEDIFIGYIVPKIFMKNQHLLMLIIHVTEVLLYPPKLYPTLYIPLFWSYMACGG